VPIYTTYASHPRVKRIEFYSSHIAQFYTIRPNIYRLDTVDIGLNFIPTRSTMAR
jgi:hypothetical protein